MQTMFAIAGREIGSLFRLPVGWIVIALYLLLSGVVFTALGLTPGEPATLREFFSVSGWLLMPVIPAVAMRLISEELRAGTIEPLMTAPVGDWSLVLGKFLGAFAFILTMLAPTLLYPLTLWLLSDPRPDLGPIATGYMCLILQGALYLSIGTLASALTNNQTLAFLLTLFSILGLLLISAFAPQIARSISSGAVADSVATVLSSLSIGVRVADFARGVIDTSHVVFFGSLSAWFLALTVLVMQSRRWR